MQLFMLVTINYSLIAVSKASSIIGFKALSLSFAEISSLVGIMSETVNIVAAFFLNVERWQIKQMLPFLQQNNCISLQQQE